MANEKQLPSKNILRNGQLHNADAISANDNYLRDCIWVDNSEPTGNYVHRGMIWIDTSVTPHIIKIRLASSWATVSTLNTDIPAYKNILDNGGFEIWQRGSGAFAVSGKYTSDKWHLSLNISTANITRESTEIKSGNYSLKIDYTHGAGGSCTIRQRVENYKEYTGKTITASMWVKSSVVSAAILGIYDGVGANHSSRNSGTGWEQLSVSRTIDVSPSELRISLTTDVQSAIIYMDNAMLVNGSNIVNYLPLSMAEEWERCQRRYEISGSEYILRGYTEAGGYVNQMYCFNVAKKNTPTITTWGISYINSSALTSERVSTHALGFYITVTATGLAHVVFHWTAEVT